MLQVLVQGAASASELPGIEALPADVTVAYADDAESLRGGIASAEVLFGWSFSDGGLADAWPLARRLRWVQWSGAGVDAALFPALRDSDVVLTNARGVFDRPMAEYALGLIIALAKQLPETLRLQQRHEWRWRVTQTLQDREALVVGVGSIGREIARVLGAFGLRVRGVGRSRRDGGVLFEEILAASELREALPTADYVVVVVPSTPASRGLLGAAEFAAMKRSAWLINLARGNVLDEDALIAALGEGAIAGAALDVFATEPLPAASPLWEMPNVIVSPHMSGDNPGHERQLVALFLDNLERYRAGLPLRNVVDKQLGFVPD